MLMKLLTLNFMMFRQINTAVQIIHIYPFNNRELWTTLENSGLNDINSEKTTNILIVAKSDSEALRYKQALRELFDEAWDKNFFYTVMGFISPTPIMTPAHVKHLYLANFPWNSVSLTIKDDGHNGWALIK